MHIWTWSLPIHFRIVGWFKWSGMWALGLVHTQVLLHGALQPLQLFNRVILVLGVGLWDRLLCLNRACPILLLGAAPAAVELTFRWLTALAGLFDDIRDPSFQYSNSLSQLRILWLLGMSYFLTIDSSLWLISTSLSLLNRFYLADQLVVSTWSKVFELHGPRLQERVKLPWRLLERWLIANTRDVVSWIVHQAVRLIIKLVDIEMENVAQSIINFWFILFWNTALSFVITRILIWNILN